MFSSSSPVLVLNAPSNEKFQFPGVNTTAEAITSGQFVLISREGWIVLSSRMPRLQLQIKGMARKVVQTELSLQDRKCLSW